MATKIYTGGAANVADVIHLTPGGTIEVGDVFRVTLGVSQVEIAASATTVASVCTDLLAALTANDVPAEFADLTWEVDDTTTPTVVIGTGPSDGRPIYASLAVATTESGGGAADAQTFAKSNPTAATGSKDWDNVDNWHDGALPTNNDTVYLGLYPIVPQYNLDQTGMTGELTALYIMNGATSGLLVGLPKVNANGFNEYLDQYLTIDTDALYYGEGVGDATPSLYLNANPANNALSVQVKRTDIRDGDGVAPLVIKNAGSAAVTITDCRGAVDLATGPDDSLTLTALTSGVGGDVRIGVNCTTTDIVMNDGQLEFNAVDTLTSLTMREGASAVINGNAGAITTITMESGTSVDWRRTATVTNFTSSGSIEFGNDNRTGKTFTNVDLFAGATWNDPNQVVTTTNGIDLNRCGIEDVSVRIGKHRRLTPGSVA